MLRLLKESVVKIFYFYILLYYGGFGVWELNLIYRYGFVCVFLGRFFSKIGYRIDYR